MSNTVMTVGIFGEIIGNIYLIKYLCILKCSTLGKFYFYKGLKTSFKKVLLNRSFNFTKVKNLTFPIVPFLSNSALLKANKHTYRCRNSISKIMGKKQKAICKLKRNTER